VSERLHVATVLVELVRFLKSWSIPIVLLLFFAGGSDMESPWILWVGIVSAGVSLLGTMFRFFTLRFGVSEGRLVIRHGLLFRRSRAIPVDRIQNLNLRSGVIHRLFGVVDLLVETAGTGEAEAQLSVVRTDRAEELRAEILERRREAAPVPKDAPDELIGRSTLPQLLLAGGTENRILVLLAALWGAFELSRDAGFDLDGLIEGTARQAAGSEQPLVVGLLLAGAFLGLGWLASIFWTLLTYHGFVLTRRGRDLHKTHGLLTRVESTIPMARLQAVRMESSLPRRLRGFMQVRADTAGSTEQEQRGGVTVMMPLLPRSSMAWFCAELFPDVDMGGVRFHRVHRRAMRRGFIRLLVPGLILCAVVLIRGEDWAWWAMAGWTVAAWALAVARYRALGYGTAGSCLVARAGVWTRRVWLVPKRKIQAVGVYQSPVQRLLGLSTLKLSTAGGSASGVVRIPDMGAPEAGALFERLSRASARGGAGV